MGKIRTHVLNLTPGSRWPKSAREAGVAAALSDHGWEDPSLAVQRSTLPGITPANTGRTFRGRGATVIDLARVDRGIAQVASLKVSGSKAHKSTVRVCTGNGDTLIAPVVKACESGLDLWIASIHAPNMRATLREYGEEILQKGKLTTVQVSEIHADTFGRVRLDLVNLGALIRRYGVGENGKGQGSRSGEADRKPVTWGITKQGKYRYASLYLSIKRATDWAIRDGASDLVPHTETVDASDDFPARLNELLTKRAGWVILP